MGKSSAAHPAAWLAVLVAPLVCHCSSSSHGSEAAPSADGGADADYGQPSTTYPAFAPSMPQVVSSGGPILKSPRIVPVFFPNDPLEAQLTDYLKKLVASVSWSTATKEYGVGSATVVPVDVPTAPASAVNDTEASAWLASQLDGTHPEFGPVDAATLASSIFVLYYPDTTTFTFMSGPTCGGGVGGYHDGLSVGGKPAAYGVIPRCTQPNTTQVDLMTERTTHEVIEAATDPLPFTMPAFFVVDADHIQWAYMFGGGEVADLCAKFPTTYFTPSDVGYAISRTWSNASAIAGHDPCVPIPPGAGPYFGSVPEHDEQVVFVYKGKSYTEKGVNVAVGQSRTIDVQFYSDGPTGPGSVAAYDGLVAMGLPPTLTLSLDAHTGVNGQRVHLTITPKATSQFGASIVRLDTWLGKSLATWFLPVGTR